MMRSIAIAISLFVAGCPRPRAPEDQILADTVSSSDSNLVGALVAELQDEVLTSYERDEPPELDTGMIVRDVGGARIGVGPGDILIATELERAPSRWPLRVERDLSTEIRSKRLETHLAQDLSAAWVFDELSWRISTCGRIAVIPLRVTMLYARDGDRWVPIFEHVSFGHPSAPRRDGELFGRTMPSIVANRDLADELSNAINPVLALASRPSSVATGPESILVGPDVSAEWHGLDVVGARLAAGPMRAEDRRVGYVGRSVESATIGYWIGNVVANLPTRPGVGAGPVRFRATFVLEKRCSKDDGDRTCRWMVVQGHVSQPIGDQDLGTRVFGTALLSSNLESGEPLRLACD